jgi:hypothetical protein
MQNRALCHTLRARVFQALLIWAIAVAGSLASGEPAGARRAASRSAVRTSRQGSSAHRKRPRHRRHTKDRTRGASGQKADCTHGRTCAARYRPPSQPGSPGDGSVPAGSARSGAGASPPTSGSLLPAGALPEASPPAQALAAEGSPPRAPTKDPAEEPPAKEPPGASYALRLFSAQSFINQPIAASAPQASDSAQLVAAFNHQVQTYYGHVVINTTEWSAPVYTVPANAPTTAVVPQNATCPRGEGVFQPLAQDISAVPIPAGAQAAKGTDEDMIVWQPSSGHEWELWRAQREGGQWTACWGGELQDAYTGEGVLPEPLGASAAGLSILAGQIHLEELQQGAITHALEVTLPDTAASEFVWPANRTDGTSDDAYSIPEGTRFRLPASLNLSSLHLNSAALEIATAIQRYGMIVADTAGAVALEAQDPTPLMREGKPNPYEKLLSGGPYEALSAVPWNQLEVVSPSYHQ